MTADVQTLISQAQCYLCLGVSQEEALELALLDRLFSAPAPILASPLVFSAILTQTGTAAPQAQVLENTLGGAITWTRTSSGHYLGTLTAAFPAGKTHILVGGGHPRSGTAVVMIGRESANQVHVATFRPPNHYEDGYLNETAVRICVYL